ncbi:hypothetical protein BU14_2437s0001 [Porphyra umbilicalis]|uniref:NADP-dependent oxidoreductase domain-containing protein n=1 Tax=Porphyra umbilicalis TaxID=2786 RepID=A0A1X6NJ59_PORUM|nr:hypothetical protein BU14_2437s0001 [Porphyra umbilicalis]|eukprot:OSX68649.1 hypothetical protein BU14_2437s0001 [Porphyra umbilicalis]
MGVMAKVKLGVSDLHVSRYGLGTMTWGIQNTEAEAFEQLDYAVGRGVNFIDTAEVYPIPSSDPRWTPGATERIIGRWLASRSAADPTLRGRLVIATKVCGYLPRSSTPRHRTDPPGAEDTAAHLDAASVAAAAAASCRRLGVETIDLLQIHWPERYVPNFGATGFQPDRAAAHGGTVEIKETLGALAALRAAGTIRWYGVSNESAVGVCLWEAAAEQMGVAPPVSIQNSYSLVHREVENGVDEAIARGTGAGLLAWSPLAGGVLTGKYLDAAQRAAEEEGAASAAAAAAAAAAVAAPPSSTLPSPSSSSSVPGVVPGKGAYRFVEYPRFQTRFMGSRCLEATARYRAIAEGAGMSLTQLALRWAASRWFMASVIVGATSMAQLAANIDALEGDGPDGAVVLPPGVNRAIDEVYLVYRDPVASI